jgi:hypothetical protein
VSETISEKPPRTIAVDFDGVIASYEKGWSGFVPTEPPVVGARAGVAALRALGFSVVVFSCRALHPAGLTGIRDWLLWHDITVDDITGSKPHAELYLDDRGLRFNGDWSDVTQLVARGVPRPWFAKQATA